MQGGQPLREPAGEEPLAAEEEKQFSGGEGQGEGSAAAERAPEEQPEGQRQDELGRDFAIAAEEPAGGENENGDQQRGLKHPQTEDHGPAAETEQGDGDGAIAVQAQVLPKRAGMRTRRNPRRSVVQGRLANGASRTARRMG